VIGPGSLPRGLWRPGRKRTLSYTRVRRRSHARVPKLPAGAAATPDNEIVFDRGPHEFPSARLVPRDSRGRAAAVVGGLVGWLSARWSWLRPRSLPAIAAIVATVGASVFADFLSRHRQPPPHSRAELVSVHVIR
jgi:hypothetical protein